MNTTNCYIWQNYLFQAIAITSQPWILILLRAICSIWKLGSSVGLGIRQNQNLKGSAFTIVKKMLFSTCFCHGKAKYALILRGQLFTDQSKKLLTPTSICSSKFIATIIIVVKSHWTLLWWSVSRQCAFVTIKENNQIRKNSQCEFLSDLMWMLKSSKCLNFMETLTVLLGVCYLKCF